MTERIKRKWEVLKEFESAETVLADHLIIGRIVDIDEHILFGMAGEETGENLDEIFLVSMIGVLETFAHIQSMRPFRAVESYPELRTAGPDLVQPFTILGDL